MSSDGWIGFDLDGSLAHYDNWVGWQHIGDPLPASVQRVKEFLAQGIKVKIFTARVCDDPNGEIERVIQDWCEEHIGVRLEVTNKKDYGMYKLYDDRAVQLIPNTGETLEERFGDAAHRMASMLQQLRFPLT